MAECQHKYAPLPGGDYYHKADMGMAYDQEVAYQMLFCKRCGTTIEVISRDHRKRV